MRARVMLSAVATAMVLMVPFATDAVAETVETIPAKKVQVAVAEPIAVEKEQAETKSPAKVAAVSVAKPKPRHVAPSVRASIDLSSQTMTVKVHGKTAHVWKISSGRKGYITPRGSYRPQWMSRMHYSKKYDNAPMPHSVFFHGGYAIHATYATGALGRPASHGCIRLSPSNAKKFYSLVSKHGKAATRIAITGSTPTYRVAKRKTKKKSYSTAYSGGSYWAPAQPKPAKRYKARRKPAPKPSYSYSYYSPKKKYRWPGDR